jgi:NAD(P)-dependent dehydrogenase (short-subunit alcohol dehydrogenase family)
MSRLDDKVAVVTGASSGFGRAIARAFAGEGAKVVVSDIREQPLAGGFEDDLDTTTVQAIEADGGTAIYVNCDVTKPDQVRALIEATVNEFGRLDILMNNAGIYRGGKLMHEFSEEDLDACFTVNVKGTWFPSQEAIKQFLRQGDGGNIINLVSTAGLQGHPKQSVYNTSKGAQANLTRCLAIEYGHEGIRVNGICPTYAKTALTRALRRQGLRPGLHGLHPAQALGRGRRHRQPGSLLGLCGVQLYARRPRARRRRRNALPLLGLTLTKSTIQQHRDRPVGPDRTQARRQVAIVTGSRWVTAQTLTANGGYTPGQPK